MKHGNHINNKNRVIKFIIDHEKNLIFKYAL